MVTRQSHNLKLVGSIPAPGRFCIHRSILVFLAQLDRATVF